MKENFRFNVLTTKDDWNKYKKLCKKHGLTSTAVMSKIFYKAIELMDNNNSLFDKVEDLEI